MAEKHPHAEIIKKWVDGAEIQGRSPSTDEWIDIPPATFSENMNDYLGVSPMHPDYVWWEHWRVKP